MKIVANAEQNNYVVAVAKKEHCELPPSLESE